MEIDHVGLATADLAAATALYATVLGFAMGERETLPQQGVDVQWLHGAGGASVELLLPLTFDSPVAKFLRNRGEGMHHLALRVPDLEATLEHCRREGLELIDQSPRAGSGGTRVAFVHPRSAGGVLVEFVESAPAGADAQP